MGDEIHNLLKSTRGFADLSFNGGRRAYETSVFGA